MEKLTLPTLNPNNLRIDKYIAEISGGLNDDDREILYRCLNIISASSIAKLLSCDSFPNAA